MEIEYGNETIQWHSIKEQKRKESRQEKYQNKIKQIEELFQAGLGREEVIEVTGDAVITIDMIWDKFKKQGAKPKKEELEPKGLSTPREAEALFGEEEKVNLVKDLIKKQYTRAEIVKETGYSGETVSQIEIFLIKEGIIAKEDIEKITYKKRNTLTPFQQQVKELVEQGKMLKEIAVELGYSAYKVQMCATQLRQKGILPEKPKRAEITPAQEKVLALVNAGYTQSEIAQQLGKSDGAVHKDMLCLENKGKIESQAIPIKKSKKEILASVRDCICAKEYEKAIIILSNVEEKKLTRKEQESVKKIKRYLEKANKQKYNSTKMETLGGEGR